MIVEQTITYKEKQYYIRADCYYVYVDDSFDHEFGTHECGHYELVSFDLFDCVDETGEEIFIDGEFFNYIKKCLEAIDYEL